MNVFTTDHPLASPQFRPESRSQAMHSYCYTVLFIAFILSSLFILGAGIGMSFEDSPDVPDPSWLDSISGIAGFIIGFPSFLFLQFDDPLGPSEKTLVYLACAFDGFFWSITSVTSYRLLKLLIRRKQYCH
jgi:hypothetical protein